jgi:hypothetical protein
MPFLNKDIYSKFKSDYCYGMAGDEVEIISDRHPALIVKLKGEKSGFSILKSDISDEHKKIEDVQIHEIVALPIKAKINFSKSVSKKSVIQTPSLF